MGLPQISVLADAAAHLTQLGVGRLATAGKEAELGILLSDVRRSGIFPQTDLESRARQIVSAARSGQAPLAKQFQNDLVGEFRRRLERPVADLLEDFTAETDPVQLALKKEAILEALWNIDGETLLAGFRKALESVHREDLRPVNAILIASWFGRKMPKAVQKMWPDPGNTTHTDLALRGHLLLLLREIGLPSRTVLEKLKSYDHAFSKNINRILREISQNKMRPEREIRAQFDDETVMAYQAFSEGIGGAAIQNQTLRVPGFKLGRTTWIKPSFTWMLYRSGYGAKDARQVRILAIRLLRKVFEELLREEEARVVQWDPERRVDLAPLPYRTIQIGIRPTAMETYLNGIIEITDMTPIAQAIQRLVRSGKLGEAEALLPEERSYPTALRG